MANGTTSIDRTFGTPTNNLKWTWSAWVKIADVQEQGLFLGYVDANNYAHIELSSTGQFKFYNHVGGSASGSIRTTGLLRDHSSFYHLVFVFDSAQATDTNRMKMYVNGVQQTGSLLTSVTYPTQSSASKINGAWAHEVGAKLGSPYNFSGVMSHVNFCDGQAYTPSDFGETDATDGMWKMKTSPSVTYGTNGFFLKMEDSSNLDLDSSGNSHTFTTSGTLTATHDCPDNNMATWDTNVPITNSNYQMAYTNGNTTVTPTSPDANGSRNYSTSTLAMPTTGKYYAEFKLVSNDNVAMVGIINTDQLNYNFHHNTGTGSSTETMVYDLAGGRILYNNVAQATGYTAVTNGNILGLAIDMDNKKFYVYVNGTIQNSSGQSFTSQVTGDLSVFICGDNTGSGYDKIEANFGNGYFGTTAITTNSGAGYAGAEGASKFNYQPRANHVALCTKGLNT